MILDQAVCLTNLGEGLKHALQLRAGVGCHVAGAQQLPPWRSGGGNDGVHKHTGIKQVTPHLEGAVVVADDDRDDGGDGMTGVKPKRFETRAHKVTIGFESRVHLGLLAHYLQSCQDGGGVGGRDAGAEDQAAGVVLDIIDRREVASHETAN